MKAKTCLRRANAEDYRIFYGRESPVDWVGWVAVRDNELIAFAFIWIDQQARAWTGIDSACEVPPLLLHRMIRDVFAAMQGEGIPELFCLCDDRIPAAPRWLARLGFVIETRQEGDALYTPIVYMPGIDKHVPVWKRTLNGGVEP